MSNKRIRCAIYTRKSTEEGLEKEFNTLEAQREACEAYIKSQQHEGWVLIDTQYNDGGFTGGNMERPALKALMEDIKAGRIDVIVVYKVDRLSRALSDFAQMVQVFDAYEVSFVSITQQFNTTTSMGRLTLNILLSFAQFEREVIGERVRDKIAASKKKGMWMGGYPPLGYDIQHRKLVANPAEAKLICEIFALHLEMRSGYQLAQLLNERGDTNKRWQNQRGVESGGQKFSHQAIYKILNNPVYIGLTRHKGKVYDGQHEGIVPMELWERVQALLKDGKEQRVTRHAKHGRLLMGKCFAPSGDIYTPTYSKKGERQYHYYIEKKSQHRIKAQDLERLVIDTIRMLARESKHWLECWKQNSTLTAKEAQHKWEALWAGWSSYAKEQRQQIVRNVVERIVITKDQLTVRLSYAGIGKAIEESVVSDVDCMVPKEEGYRPLVVQEERHLEITIPARFEVYGRSQIAVDGAGLPIRAFKRSNYNQVLVNALVRSYQWNQLLESGKTSVTELAKREGRSRTYISRILNLRYLAPEIIESILTGTQPETLHLKGLTQILPIEWHCQKRLLNFPVSAQ